MEIREFFHEVGKSRKVYMWLILRRGKGVQSLFEPDHGVYIKLAKKQCYWLISLCESKGITDIPAFKDNDNLYLNYESQENFSKGETFFKEEDK